MVAGSRKTLLLGPGLIAALLVAWVALFASRGLFSGDSGMKLAQAEALWRSGFHSRALPYDHRVDPNDLYRPYGDLFIRVGHSRQGIYSWVFTGAAAPLIGLFGLWGMLVLPLLGGVLIALGVWRIMRRLGYELGWAFGAAAIATFATPVLFYSSQFCAHTLAAGLVATALSLVVPCAESNRRALAAGALTALAASVRPECYCAVAAVGVALVAEPGDHWRARVERGASYLAGAVPVLLLYWGVNLHTAGVWDLAVRRNHARSSSLHDAATMLVGTLRGGGHPAAWLAVTILAAVVGLLQAYRAKPGLRVAIHVAAGAALIAALWRTHALAHGRTAVGLFSVTPLAAYGLFAGPRRSTRTLWLFAVLFVAQVAALDKSGTAGGLQLGARLLMPALPPLIALGVAIAAEDARAAAPRSLRRASAVVSAAFVLVTALVFGLALPPARAIAADGWTATERALEAPADVIVTQVWWQSQVLAPVILKGKRLYDAHGHLRRLLSTLAEHGAHSVLLVSRAPPPAALSGGYRARTQRRWPGWLTLQLVQIQRASP